MQASTTSDAPLPRRLTGVAADPIEKQRERARLAREAQALKRLQGRISKMDREQAIKHMESLLKNKNTPVQYHAAIMSQLSDLNMWKRASTDADSQTSICDMLASWKREDAGAYAGLMNQAGVSDTKRIGVGDAKVARPATTDGGGEPPRESTPAEALDPLTAATSPEKVTDVTDSKRVTSTQPEDGWME